MQQKNIFFRSVELQYQASFCIHKRINKAASWWCINVLFLFWILIYNREHSYQLNSDVLNSTSNVSREGDGNLGKVWFFYPNIITIDQNHYKNFQNHQYFMKNGSCHFWKPPKNVTLKIPNCVKLEKNWDPSLTSYKFLPLLDVQHEVIISTFFVTV